MIGILGQTAQLELFDLEANLAPPSNSGGFAAPKESLYELLAGQQALVDEDTKTNWYLFDENKKLVAGPVTERDKLLQSEAVDRGGREAGKLPKGWQHLRRPAEDGRRHLRRRRGRLPGRERREPEAELLLPLQLRPGQCGSEQGRPRDDRRRPEVGRHAAGLRHDDR